MKCLLLGSSGATGRELLKLLVGDPSIEEIVCLNRRLLNVIIVSFAIVKLLLKSKMATSIHLQRGQSYFVALGVAIAQR